MKRRDVEDELRNSSYSTRTSTSNTILARPDIGANAHCHLIGRDDENILSSCIDQSDDTIHLLRYLHNRREQNNKDGRARITRIKSDFTEKTK